MRKPRPKDFFKTLEMLSEKAPELRLGQLIEVAVTGKIPTFFVEDEDLLQYIEEFLKRY